MKQRQANKKVKSNNSDLVWLRLGDFEISSILCFLTVGEAIMMALTCKDVYTRIEQTAMNEQRDCLDVYENEKWSIARALRTKTCLVISSEPQMKGLLEYTQKHKMLLSKNITLLKSRKFLHCVMWPYLYELIEILSIEVGQVVQMDVIRMETSEAKMKDDSLVRESIRVNVSVGHQLTSLSLRSDAYTMFHIMHILSICPNLESLEILDRGHIGGRRKLTIKEKEETEENHPNFSQVNVPMLRRLKSLHLEGHKDYCTDGRLAERILHLTPNLQVFIYHSRIVLSDKFLELLATLCPLLRLCSIDCIDAFSHEPNTFSNAGILKFLDALPCLSKVAITDCAQVTNDIWAKIGKYNNLKRIFITIYSTEDLDSAQKDIVMNGSLDSLEFLGCYLHMSDEFIRSVARTAPNLKYLGSATNEDQFLQYQVLPNIEEAHISNPDNLSAIVLSEKLTVVHLYSNSACNYQLPKGYLKSCKWTNLLYFSSDSVYTTNTDNPFDWIYDLATACPKIQKLDVSETESDLVDTLKSTLFSVLQDINHFPNLQILIENCQLDQDSRISQILILRPLLVLFPRSMYNEHQKALAKDNFLREWLTVDRYSSLDDYNHESFLYGDLADVFE